MLNRDEVRLAVDLQHRSYNLLRWLSTAMTKGFVRFDRAHDYLDEVGAAKEWIERHLLNLPPSCRPALEHLDPFAQFFATYLTTSFDLVEKPKKRVASACGCFCPICTTLVTAPQLKAKKVLRRDKARARKLKVRAIQEIAREHNLQLDQQKAEKLIDSESGEYVSLVAYGLQLVSRMQGSSDGPSVLALWREIAWEKTGSPKKNFKLEANDILNAEKALTETILTI
jgi:hypothetical protein